MLLRNISFYRKALGLQKKYGRVQNIDNLLQTNGTLLTGEWCRFFKDNIFLIGISIDGPEHCPNNYRKNKGGKETFRQVMKGIELLQKHGVEFNTLSVINNYNVDYPLEIYNFFKENWQSLYAVCTYCGKDNAKQPGWIKSASA